MLEIVGLEKQYGAVPVLKSMSMTVAHGEVRALMGVNGAGKSTLVNVLGGVVMKSAGTIRLDGEDYSPSTPSEARTAGVAIVHQELSLVPGLTVAENITLGQWSVNRRLGVRSIDRKAVDRIARTALSTLGESIDLRLLVGDLAPAQQQLVEIAKALVGQPRVLILDEPTSSLAKAEVGRLLDLVRRLARSGVSVIYVSHRMDEIPRVADSVTILRDGREVQTSPVSEMDTRTIANLMVGQEVAARQDRSTTGGADGDGGGTPALEVRGLSRPGVLDDISFAVHEGEVLGLVGLMGAGRTEILRAAFGLDAATGQVVVNGRPIPKRSPRSMIRAGVGFTPEDRKGQGLVLGLSVSANLMMTAFDQIRHRGGFLSARREDRLARQIIAKQSIATSGPAQEVGTLSGGNQQKVVIGKWLNRGSRVLLLDEPTRGVDVHAKAQTYDTIAAIAAGGGSVVFVSSEVEEVFLVCDRVLVVHAGKIVAERAVASTTSEEILSLSMTTEDEAA